MKKRLFILILLLFVMTGCQAQISEEDIDSNQNKVNVEKTDMKIKVENKDLVIIFQLNLSNASKSLYNQLPIELAVENYSTNEKIFYPLSKLDISHTPMAKGDKGTLAYFSSWDNVVMYYDTFSPYNGLYELSGTIRITKVTN